MATLHYTAGDNINAQGTYTPAQAGFNLADVSSVDELNSLPAGVKGLVWLDKGSGVTQDFINAVTPYIGNPKVYGFYLKDEPDPTGQWNTLVTAADLKAESDWIHANVPGAKTFITMMNMGSSDNPSFANTYTPENTHIDLFGLDPYPVRSESSTIDYNMIDRTVAAAQSAGIPLDKIVPVFQTFGGGNWVTDGGGKYVMPTAAQEQQIFDHWAKLVPNPAFDYAYAWGAQNGDVSLESSQELQSAFLTHNSSGSTTSTATTPVDTTPVSDTSGTTTTTSGSTSSSSSDPTGTTTSTSGSSSSSSSDPTSTPTTTDHSGHHHADSGTHHHHSTTQVAAPTLTAATDTVTTQPVAAAQTQQPDSSNGHGQTLDFSKLLASWADNHPNHWAAKLVAAADTSTTATAATDTTVNHVSDLVHALTDHNHAGNQTDHHWNW